MDWLKTSIMKSRGGGRAREAQTHHLTEAQQGTYHYTIGPYSEPVLTIHPGDRVIVETRDAFEGVIQTEQDLPSDKLTLPFVNPRRCPHLSGRW